MAWLRESKALANVNAPGGLVGYQAQPTATGRGQLAVPFVQVYGNIRPQPQRDYVDLSDAQVALAKITWAFRAVNAIAQNWAKLTVEVRRGDPVTGAEVASNPALDLLNRSPNPWESAWSFRYRLSATVLTSRKGAFVQKLRRNDDSVYAISLLPADKVAPIPDPDTFVSGYEVNNGREPGDRPVLAPDDVLWIKLPHPYNPYMGMTPLDPCLTAAETDWLASQFNNGFLKSDQRPGGLLLLKGEVADEDDLDEIRARFGAAGPAGAGRTTVMEGESATYVDTSINPRDLQYVEARDKAKDEILMAFGVPESKAGNASGRTFDNADAEGENFWLEAMQPHGTLLGRGLDDLTGQPGRLFVGYDYTGVPELQRHEESRRTSLLAEYQAGVITKQEYREDTGRPPEAPGDFRQPITVLPVARQGGGGASPGGAGQPPATPPPSGGGGQPAPQPEPPKWALPTPRYVTWGGKRVEVNALEMKRNLVAGRFHTWELTAKAAMATYFTRQERVVLEKLRGQKGRQRVLTKQLGADDVFDRDRWNEELSVDAKVWLEGVMTDAGTSTGLALGVGFDLEAPGVQAALQGRANKVVGVNDTTFDDIRQALQDGYADGDSVDGLADRIAQVYADAKGYRSEMIARTEVTGAANEASTVVAADSGVADTKTWLATEDDRTRPDHADVDGTTVGIDETFSVGDDDMLYPGDQNADPGNVVNCRCTLLYGSSTEGDSLLG